jgi:hypothetical protein
LGLPVILSLYIHIFGFPVLLSVCNLMSNIISNMDKQKQFISAENVLN